MRQASRENDHRETAHESDKQQLTPLFAIVVFARPLPPEHAHEYTTLQDVRLAQHDDGSIQCEEALGELVEPEKDGNIDREQVQSRIVVTSSGELLQYTQREWERQLRHLS